MSEPASNLDLRSLATVVVLTAGAQHVGALTYEIPPSMEIEAGQRVLVPFRSRKLTGIVVAANCEAPEASFEIRQILEKLDKQPILDAAHLKLIEFAANYYLVPIEDAFRSIIPAAFRVESGRVIALVREPAPLEAAALNEVEKAIVTRIAKAPRTIRQLGNLGTPNAITRALSHMRTRGIVEDRQSSRGRHRQSADLIVSLIASAVSKPRGPRQLKIVEPLTLAGSDGIPLAQLETEVPGAKAAIKSMAARGIVRLTPSSLSIKRDTESPHRLTDEQQTAISAVEPALAEHRFAPFLLWGVTGSGKTEVYLRLTAQALEAGQQVLVLVPEIALADELVRSFRARFGEVVAVAHSGQTVVERWKSWNSALSLNARVMIGPRSAIFAPISNLGLVIVDEEHDAAFKQEEGIRYHARDLAVALANFSSAPIVLGSATPSAESYANWLSGRYKLLRLMNRIEGRSLASVELVDLRAEFAKRKSEEQKPAKKDTEKRPSPVPISSALVEALRGNLEQRGQSIIFMNRRGFHNFLQCHICGNVISCGNCSVAMTFHLRDRSLRCHYCGEHKPAPELCPACGGYGLEGQGFGTERITAVLQELMPNARIDRMDSDTARRRGARAQVLTALRKHELDVLVGTQMIAKGLDFPGVTLVGVILADLSLNMPDFRSAERTFQLLTQVSGRAGRGDRPGRVIIQTYAPHHYSVRAAADQDYARFIRRELKLRREASYPPYARMALVRTEAEDPPAIEKIASMAAKAIESTFSDGSVEVLGPAPSPIERIKRRYRWQLMVRSQSLTKIRQALVVAREKAGELARRNQVRMTIDIDPVSML